MVAGKTGRLEVALAMSAMGHKQTLERVLIMSALPPKADIETRSRYQLRRNNSRRS
jgi:hypothetical protein